MRAQAVKQALDDALGTPTSYADLMAISGAAAIYNTKGPLINVGYGRPDVDGPDPFQGVGSNTNQQRDYPIQAIINEWGKFVSPWPAVWLSSVSHPPARPLGAVCQSLKSAHAFAHTHLDRAATCAASYGFTIEELVTLSGAHTIGLSASTNPQVRLAPWCLHPSPAKHQLPAESGYLLHAGKMLGQWAEP